MTGTISKVISDKGFGFIQGEDRQEYFMHRSAVRDGSVFEQLRESQPVASINVIVGLPAFLSSSAACPSPHQSLL